MTRLLDLRVLASLAAVLVVPLTAHGQAMEAMRGFQANVDIAVPAFHGIEPKLAIPYGRAGGGADVETGRIERKSSGATSTLWLDGVQLFACQATTPSPSCHTGGTHYTKIESYDLIRYTASTDTWDVWTKSGSHIVYSPVFRPGTALAYRYDLTRVSKHGNDVLYNWTCDTTSVVISGETGNDCYLDNVQYDGVTVKLYRALRPAIPALFPTGGARLGVTNYQLKSVEVSVSGHVLRAYKIAYTQDAVGRSLLQSAAMYGKDVAIDANGNITGGTTLPAGSVTYSGFASPTYMYTWGNAPLTGNYYMPVDVDGDGKTDLLDISSVDGSIWQVFTKATASGFSTYDQVKGFPTDWMNLAGAKGVVGGLLPMTLTPDNRTSMVELYADVTGALTIRAYAATGTAFSPTPFINQTFSVWPGSGFATGDLNGDGYTDFVFWSEFPSSGTSQKNSQAFIYDPVAKAFVASSPRLLPTSSAMANQINRLDLIDLDGDGISDYLYSSGGLYTNVSGTFQQVSGGPQSLLYSFEDLNSDGRMDIVTSSGLPTAMSFSSYFWNGTGFDAVSSSVSTPNTENIVAYGDFNGDGTVDAIGYGSGPGWNLFAGAGDGRFTVRSFLSSTTEGSANLAMDIDGDGVADLLSVNPATGAGPLFMSDPLGNGKPANLVVQRTNELGGSVAYGYTSSSAWPNNACPGVFPTLSSMTYSDGRGNSYVETSSFSGCKYDRVNRISLGFAQMIVTDKHAPGAATAPYTLTTMRQDAGIGAQPFEVDRYDSSGPSMATGGRLLARKLYYYNIHNTTVPYSSEKTDAWDYACDPSTVTCTAFVRRLVHYHYDSDTYVVGNAISANNSNFGNIVQEDDYGIYDIAGDETSTQSRYYPNTAAYMVGLPGRLTVYAASFAGGTWTLGAMQTDAENVYDGQASYQDPPVKGDITQQLGWLDTNNSWVVQRTLTYDAYGNLTGSYDGDTSAPLTTYVYDSSYHLFPMQVTNAAGHSTTYAYDFTCQLPTQVKDANNVIASTTTLDALCRTTRIDGPAGSGKYQAFAWGNWGNPNSQYTEAYSPAADGSGSTPYTLQYIDGLGRTWRYITGSNNTFLTGAVITFDSRGRKYGESMPYLTSNPTYLYTYTTYDDLDRVVKVQHPDNTSRTISYGFAGGYQTVTSVDEMGHTTTDTLDHASRVLVHHEVNGAQTTDTRYTYDDSGHVARIVDALGNTDTFTWDSLSRQTARHSPDEGTITTAYNTRDQVVAITDNLDQTTTFAYDKLGRLVRKQNAAGTYTWTYDEVRPASGQCTINGIASYCNIGRLTSYSDPSGSGTQDYDWDGNPLRTVRTIGASSWTLTKKYDAMGRLLGTTYPDGETATVAYDSAGRQVALSIAGTVIASGAQYDAHQRLTALTLGNGATATYGFDSNRGWINSARFVDGGTTYQSLAYTHDADGLLTQVTSTRPGESWVYGYDALHRLTSANNTSNSALSQFFTYDAIGNIVNRTTGQVSMAYSYPASGPSSIRPHAVTRAGANSYGYDGNGDMTSWAGRTIAYDANRHVVSINAGQETFAYDGNGNRLEQVVNGVATYYPFGDDFEVSGGVTTKYFRFHGALVAKRVGTTNYWMFGDVRGSISSIVSASGSEIEHATYLPDGERGSTSLASGFTADPFGFTGQRHDASGLVFLHARYYDPAISRFISPDPTIPTSASIGLDRYAYGNNDPAGNVDPTGLAAQGGGPVAPSTITNVPSWWVQDGCNLGWSEQCREDQQAWNDQQALNKAGLGNISLIIVSPGERPQTAVSAYATYLLDKGYLDAEEISRMTAREPGTMGALSIVVWGAGDNPDPYSGDHPKKEETTVVMEYPGQYQEPEYLHFPVTWYNIGGRATPYPEIRVGNQPNRSDLLSYDKAVRNDALRAMDALHVFMAHFHIGGAEVCEVGHAPEANISEFGFGHEGLLISNIISSYYSYYEWRDHVRIDKVVVALPGNKKTCSADVPYVIAMGANIFFDVILDPEFGIETATVDTASNAITSCP